MDDAKQQLWNYSKGWTCGASVGSIPEDLGTDTDFLSGWSDGRKARRQAAAEAEEKYGVKFAVIRLEKS